MASFAQILAIAFAIFGAAAAIDAACTKASPYVGFSGPLTTIDHMIGGTVTILDDCSFKVTNFSYDGLAPAVHWWGAKSLSVKDLRNGQELNPMLVTGPVNGLEMTVPLLTQGATWDNVTYIVAWCETALADFGHVKLMPAAMAMAPSMSAAGRKMLEN
ncbi:g5728 [Coccomyxa elongata]